MGQRRSRDRCVYYDESHGASVVNNSFGGAREGAVCFTEDGSSQVGQVCLYVGGIRVRSRGRARGKESPGRTGKWGGSPQGRGFLGGCRDIFCHGAGSGVVFPSGGAVLDGQNLRFALLNSLVPPTIAAHDCMGSLGGRWGGPLAEGPGGAGTAEGWGREVWPGGAAETCAGGRYATQCHRSRRLDWIWLSWVEWSTPSGRELGTRDSRSLVSRWSSFISLRSADMAWTREQRRGRIVLSARERSPIWPREGTGSCSAVRPVSCLVFRRKW